MKTKPSQKKPITVRTVAVKIYPTPRDGYDAWTVAWSDGHGRKRKIFSNLESAKRHAEDQADKLLKGQTIALDFDNRDAASFARAVQMLPPGKPLELAVSEYADAVSKLNGASLSSVVDYYLRGSFNLTDRTVTEVVDDLIEAKKSDGLSAIYLKELKVRLGKLKDRFKCPIQHLNGVELDTWLRSLGLSPRTRNNYRTCLTTLFAFAKTRRYLPRDWHEMESVGTAKPPPTPIEILTVGEMNALLAAAPVALVPFLAIAAFAGLRHEEILRLDWKEINFSAGHIEIKAANAKTASRRLAPLPSNLNTILKPVAQKSGPVATGVVHMKLRRLAESMGVKWKRNALRHSFISYRVAAIKNVNQVALEAGNSPKIIFSNYRELVTSAQGRAWFKVRHQSVITNRAVDLKLLKSPKKAA